VTLVADRGARRRAPGDDRRLAGKRWAVAWLADRAQDLAETAGIRTTFGSPIFKDNVPASSALHIERIQRAGAITIGKTIHPNSRGLADV